jgi:hypothetical protein
MVMQGSFELQGSRGFGEASCRKKAARPAVFARASIDAPWSASAHLFSQPGRNLKGHEGPSAMRSMRPMLANNTRRHTKRIYQIPPDLGETMRTAGRYRAAASDLKLEKPE